MSQELKPCPFCGSEGWISEPFDDCRFYVSCQGKECWASIGENYDTDGLPDHRYYSREAAVAAWNTRASERTNAALLGALKRLATEMDYVHEAADMVRQGADVNLVRSSEGQEALKQARAAIAEAETTGGPNG